MGQGRAGEGEGKEEGLTHEDRRVCVVDWETSRCRCCCCHLTPLSLIRPTTSACVSSGFRSHGWERVKCLRRREMNKATRRRERGIDQRRPGTESGHVRDPTERKSVAESEHISRRRR